MNFGPPGCSVCNCPLASHSREQEAACELRFREIVDQIDKARDEARAAESFFRDVVIPHRTQSVLAEFNDELADVLPSGCQFVMEPLERQ
jgi:hypothetical protein